MADLAVCGQLHFLHDKIVSEGQRAIEPYPELTELCLRLDVMTD